MIHPTWWPRVSCVYCGARTDEPDPLDAGYFWRGTPYRHRDRFACWRHRSLVPLDLYTVGDKAVDELLASPRGLFDMVEAE